MREIQRKHIKKNSKLDEDNSKTISSIAHGRFELESDNKLGNLINIKKIEQPVLTTQNNGIIKH